jgi:hypothetical protein
MGLCDEDHRHLFPVGRSMALILGVGMESPSTAGTVYKLALAGEQAGFSLEDMISLLNSGVTVETLLQLIEWRLTTVANEPRSARWVM